MKMFFQKLLWRIEEIRWDLRSKVSLFSVWMVRPPFTQICL